MKSREEARRRREEARQEREETVRLAVQAHMAARQWNKAELQIAARIDANTAGDFLNGERWPQARTLAKIETALDWPHGTIAAILAGASPPATSGDAGDEPLQADDPEAALAAIDAMRIPESKKDALRVMATALLFPAGRPPTGPERLRRTAGS